MLGLYSKSKITTVNIIPLTDIVTIWQNQTVRYQEYNLHTKGNTFTHKQN